MSKVNFDTYWTLDDFSVEGTCQSCQERKLVAYTANPYAEDMFGDDRPMWICAECHYESGRDV